MSFEYLVDICFFEMLPPLRGGSSSDSLMSIFTIDTQNFTQMDYNNFAPSKKSLDAPGFQPGMASTWSKYSNYWATVDLQLTSIFTSLVPVKILRKLKFMDGNQLFFRFFVNQKV
jgi:hypothetical protein